MNCRLEGAIIAVRDAVALAACLPADSIGTDDDLRNDLHLQAMELESLALILEEIFFVVVSKALWITPLHRTPAALAEWLIHKSDEAAWAEAKRKCA